MFPEKKIVKKIVFIAFYSVIFLLFAAKVWAATPDKLFFKPAISVEYSAPILTSGGVNSEFRTNNFGKQMNNFQNLTLGGNFRVHKSLGFNLNWTQTELRNDSLQNIGFLSQEAHFKMDQYNFSVLAYAPVDKNEILEIFAEAGISDMNSKLTYVTSGGDSVSNKAHETMAFYGLGFQARVSKKSGDAIRFSFQKYSGKMALTDTNYTAIRLGYLKVF
jgi:hypothetical protein